MSDRIIYECTNFEAEGWHPDPFPGSLKAQGAGCTCPVWQPWPTGIRFASDCPIHKLERSPS